jgi:hypothetical protein
MLFAASILVYKQYVTKCLKKNSFLKFEPPFSMYEFWH